MRLILTLAAALAATAAWAAGPVTSGPAADDVKKVDAAMSAAAVKRDLATIDRLTADEYLLTDPAGEVTDKKTNLTAFKIGSLAIESAKDWDVKAAVYGDTAVLTGHTVFTGKYQGQDISGPYRWTRVYVKRDGRWQCAAEQMTRVMKP